MKTFFKIAGNSLRHTVRTHLLDFWL